MTDSQPTKQQKANKKLAIKVLYVVIGSLLFAFALVPLY
ncbi:MAG: cytochrome C oxidase assembly protein, partial [Methylophilales bacterium 16-45-7]